MKVRAVKTGRYSESFFKAGEVFEIPDEIFVQYEQAFLTWVEKVEEPKEAIV